MIPWLSVGGNALDPMVVSVGGSALDPMVIEPASVCAFGFRCEPLGCPLPHDEGKLHSLLNVGFKPGLHKMTVWFKPAKFRMEWGYCIQN